MSFEQTLRESYIAVRRRLYAMTPASRPVKLEPKAHIRPYKPADAAAQMLALVEAQRRLAKAWEAPAPAPYDDVSVIVPANATRRIIDEVCAKHNVKYREIVGDSRSVPIVRARQEVCYRIREERQLSWPQIGRLVGGRDHTTALHSYRVHKARMSVERLP